MDGFEVIESISPSKRGGKLLIKLESGTIIRIDKKAALGYGLAEGDILSREKIEELLKHRGLSADESAALTLARRSYSEKELAKKLCEKGYTEDEISAAADKLKENGFLDDRAYAEEVCSFLSAKKRSHRAAVSELRQRGVDRETAQRAVEGMPPDSEAIMALIEKRFGPGAAQTREAWTKVFNYLMARGFQSGDIYDALRRAKCGGDDEEL